MYLMRKKFTDHVIVAIRIGSLCHTLVIFKKVRAYQHLH